MLLLIDVGNTNTVFGLYENDESIVQWRSATDSRQTADDYAVWLGQLFRLENVEFTDINSCLISSVVPHGQFHFRNLCRRYFKIEPKFIGESDVRLQINVRVKSPELVGADRLVNAVGAFMAHGGPLIVVDSGTATTFDIVGQDGGFEGGIIAPGLTLSMQALHEAAASLPRVAIQKPENVIGKDTVSAMQSGIFLGYLELIDGLIRRIREEYHEEMKVIGTGGIASLFRNDSKEIDVFDSDITMNGLLEVYRRNRG